MWGPILTEWGQRSPPEALVALSRKPRWLQLSDLLLMMPPPINPFASSHRKTASSKGIARAP